MEEECALAEKDEILRQYSEDFEDNFRIWHARSENGKTGNFHIHKVFEITFILTPGAECQIDNLTIEPKAGSLLIFNDMDLHRVRCPADLPYERYVMYFTPECIEKLCTEQTDLLRCFFSRTTPETAYLPLSVSEAKRVREYMDKTIEYSGSLTDYGSDLLRRCAICELLIYLNKMFFAHYPIDMPRRHADYRRAYTAMRYIHENLGEDLTLESISAKMFVSKNHFCKLFSDIVGCTPMKYVRQCRIMKAKEYLCNGFSVDDTCRLTGFNNLSHFSYIFKKETGLSPKKYAEEQKQ